MLAKDRPTVDIILKYSNIEAVVDEELGRLIHSAASNNNIILTEALVERKAVLNVENSEEFTPLSIAAKRGSYEVLEVLLDSGVSPNDTRDTFNLYSTLNTAVQFGHLDCVQLLTKHGARLGDEKCLRHALSVAAESGHVHIAEYLIKEMKMDVNLVNRLGLTPIYLSVTEGHTSVTKLLLDHGANPNVSMHYNTPLHEAIRNENREIMKMLLDAKAKPDEPDGDGMSPLMMAVEKDNADYIPFLEARDIKLLQKDNHGNTVFHHAARNGSSASVKYLMGQIDYFVREDELYKNKNHSGETPFTIALDYKRARVLKIFIVFAPIRYFCSNPRQVHKLFDTKQFDTLKEVMNESTKEGIVPGNLSFA